MENYSYSSYPNSHDSSPRSREIDCENPSWDEPPSSFRVKFMCSYGGKIQPRPHDNQLAYVGGDTKILSVDRNIKFAGIMSKLSSFCDGEVCFKYQLPGEDLDALISVTNDEDLDHMMLEYDRLYRASTKPARLRLFLFPVNPPAPTSFDSNSSKSERQWFVDALNAVQIQPLETPSPSAAVSAANPDFLFGLEKGAAPVQVQVPVPVMKLQDPTPPPTVPDVVQKESGVGSDRGSEDHRHVVMGDPVMSQVEIQRQIHELQRLQIAASQEQAILQRKSDESNPRGYTGEYYTQKMPEKPAPAPQAMPMTLQPAYWPERHMATGGYQMANATGTDQPVYLIQTHGGMYQTQAMRPVTGQVNQAYYGMQRMMPEVYREQPVYSAAPPPSIQQQKVGGYTEGMGMVRPPPTSVGMAEAGYTQVGYDGAGRQVFYTTSGAAVVPPSYQAVAPASAALDPRQQGGALNQEGKVINVVKPPQTSSG